MQSVEVQTPSKTFPFSCSFLLPRWGLTGRAEIAYPWGQLKGVVDPRAGLLRDVPCTTWSYPARHIHGQFFWQSWRSQGPFSLWTSSTVASVVNPLSLSPPHPLAMPERSLHGGPTHCYHSRPLVSIHSSGQARTSGSFHITQKPRDPWDSVFDPVYV